MPVASDKFGDTLCVCARDGQGRAKNLPAGHARMLKPPPSRVLESPPAEAALGPPPTPARPDRATGRLPPTSRAARGVRATASGLRVTRGGGRPLGKCGRRAEAARLRSTPRPASPPHRGPPGGRQPGSSRGPLHDAKLRRRRTRRRGSSPALPSEAGCTYFNRPVACPSPPSRPALLSGGRPSQESPLSPPRATGPAAAGGSGPRPAPAEPPVRMLRRSPHRARVNPDRAIARPAERSSSGAIG